MRKNAKRIMAVVTAATMTLGSGITAMAAAPSATAPTPQTITGGGDISYVDTSKQYEVTLPTAGALDFVIDPQGLTSLENGQSAKLEDILNNSSIVSKTGAGAYIKNESSTGVKVTVKMNITDDNDTKVTPVDSLDAVTADTTTNICLLAIPGSDKFSDIDDYVASSQGIVIEGTSSSNATEFSFVLDKASYSIHKDNNGDLSYAKDTAADNFDAASFKLGGKANGKANWSAYTTGDTPKSIGVNAVFSVADAASTDVQKDGYTSHGLMDLGSTKSLTLTPPASAPDIATKAYNFDRTADLTIPVSLGTENLKASDIASVSWATAADGDYTAWVKGSSYTYANEVLTVKSGAWMSRSVGTKMYLKVVFNDTAATPVVLELTITK